MKVACRPGLRLGWVPARMRNSIQSDGMPCCPIVSLLYPEAISRFFEIPLEKSYWIPLSVLIALFSIYYETLLAYNVIEQKPLQYLKFSVVKILLEVGLTLSFISIFKFSWEGRLPSREPHEQRLARA